jgi:cytochrome b6-f complex iron-sulfur subunit
MDTGTIFLLSVLAILGMAFVFLFATARRRDTERALDHLPPEEAEPALVGAETPATRPSGREVERSVALERHRQAPRPVAPPPPPAIPDEETLGVSRRQVLNRGILVSMVLGISAFSGASLAMLWPSLSGGFGGRIRVGRLDEVMSEIANTREPLYVGAGRFYITPYPREAVPAARNVTAYGAVLEGYEEGVTALYQKCPHLGCRVPWCKTSQWFECPCHGSQYNRVGEKKGGPAPRGMDRFVVSVDGGVITVDTGLVIPGPPIGTNTTGQESEGPHCIGALEGGH